MATNRDLLYYGLQRLRVRPVFRRFANNMSSKVFGSLLINDVAQLTPYNTKYVAQFLAMVRCQVLGVFYLGPNQLSDNLDHQVNGYWRHRARRQFGNHLCLERTGHINAVALEINMEGNDLQIHRAPINQLYPCVRQVYREEVTDPVGVVLAVNEEICHDQHWVLRVRAYQLTVGLSYWRLINANDTNQNYNEGFRSYVRQDEEVKQHPWGRVFEVTAAGNAMGELAAQSQGSHFALYVCAGAKLLMTDFYNGNVNDSTGHQRTLVQQGGVVLVEGELIMRSPSLQKNLRFRTTDTGQTITIQTNTGPKDTGKQCPLRSVAGDVNNALVRAIQCPVLFLAPNESEYGSIAWELSFRRVFISKTNQQELRHRECLLMAPEGGRVEAILNWTEGSQELEARHRYERLYESCVQMNNEAFHEQGFACPADPALMMQILTNRRVGTGPDRTLTVDIDINYAAFRALRHADHQPLPVQYNSHRVVRWLTDQSRFDVRPPVAPKWPLIQYSSTGGKRFNKHTEPPVGYGFAPDTGRVLPTKDLYQMLPNSQYFWAYEKQPDLYPRPVYWFVRQPFHTRPEDVCDGSRGYVGIDGWVYRKISTGKDTDIIVECESVYYRIADDWDWI